MNGSEGFFHDENCTFSRVLTLVLNFILCKSVSEGCWKLSHTIVPVVLSRKIKFPESKSWALELATEFVTFDDQRISFYPSNITRFSSSDIVRTPEESLSGFSLLATLWAGRADFLLYHIPR